MSADFDARLTAAISRHVYKQPDPPKPGWLRPKSACPTFGGYAASSRAASEVSVPPAKNVSFTSQGAAAAGGGNAVGGSGRVYMVSKQAKEFNDRHMWVDKRGNVVASPQLQVEDDKEFQVPKVNFRPKSAAVRRAEQAEFSKNLWKTVNPGYLPLNPKPSQYAFDHDFAMKDLEMSKGHPMLWKQHFRKTDFSEYTEAVARATFVGNAGSLATQSRR